MSSALDSYAAGFRARCEALRSPDQRVLDAIGIFGVLASQSAPLARLLITDDRAHDRLDAAVDGASAMTVTIFGQATRCNALLAGDAAWGAEHLTAMVCPDLEAVMRLALPEGLGLSRVERPGRDRAGHVSLEEAVTVATRASSLSADEAQGLARFLLTAGSELELLAARDRGGAVRATSGFEIVGDEATVLFVNIDPDWQRRGIGVAMTSAALIAARHAGAHRARPPQAPPACRSTGGWASAAPVRSSATDTGSSPDRRLGAASSLRSGRPKRGREPATRRGRVRERSGSPLRTSR